MSDSLDPLIRGNDVNTRESKTNYQSFKFKKQGVPATQEMKNLTEAKKHITRPRSLTEEGKVVKKASQSSPQMISISRMPNPKARSASLPEDKVKMANDEMENKIMDEFKKIISNLPENEQQEKILEMKGVLSKTLNNKLPKPTVRGHYLVMWRGLKPSQLAKMLMTNSAGGEPQNKETSKPAEKESKDQVGEKEPLPEFTMDTGIANQYGTNSVVAAFKIEARYLNTGSVSERGYVCNHDAPIELIGWCPGRELGIKG